MRGYWRRLSGPLLDRIDLVVNVEPVDLDELITEHIRAEDSEAVRRRVTAARDAQAERWKHLGPMGAVAATNASLPAKLLPAVCRLSSSQLRRARREASSLGISARGWHRVLRVARTVADLEQREELRYADLAEAFQYRRSGLELSAAAAQFTPG